LEKGWAAKGWLASAMRAVEEDMVANMGYGFEGDGVRDRMEWTT